MGLVKNMMMELENDTREVSFATFMCPICESTSECEVEIPVVQDHYTYERTDELNIECAECGKQYSAEFQKTANGCAIELKDYPEVRIEFQPIYFADDFYDEWEQDPYFYDRPAEPFELFKEANGELRVSVMRIATTGGDSSMNRMFFSQSFSIFETYLCDSFLKLVFLNLDHQKKFIHSYKETKELELSLSELILHHDLLASEIIKKKLTQVIKKNLFHNFEKVLSLYRIYGIDFLKNNANKDILFKAVEYRHHAVHRNGADLEGKKLTVYTKDYIVQISDVMTEIAGNIDAAFNAHFQNAKLIPKNA